MTARTQPTSQRLCQDDDTLAPAWHTALLVGLMLAVAVTGAILQLRNATTVAPSRPAFLPMFVVQWALVAYVARVGRRRSALGVLIGTRWDTWQRAATDVALGAAWMVGIVVLERIFATPTAPGTPLTPLEKVAWVPTALSVGFAEELVYRGYLQRQLGAFLRSPWAGIALQAVLFGVAHGDRGLAPAVRIALYGLGFGIIAWRRRSLIPGILCHCALDVVGGLR